MVLALLFSLTISAFIDIIINMVTFRSAILLIVVYLSDLFLSLSLFSNLL